MNHTILSNKDGRHAWRPFQLIHPVIYVSLVNCLVANWSELQQRFSEFAAAAPITCCSVPLQSPSNHKDAAAQILNWWERIEQASLKLALEFNHVFHADITDCYGAIYTHSISWALHGQAKAKVARGSNLLGNAIDLHLQAMHYGQTNGIPQGSVLMDFIAELVLGHADLLLHDKLKGHAGSEYRILRYRDDYRIFVNSPQLGEQILKALTEILSHLGLKLNVSKTKPSQPVVTSALKAEKWDWLCSRQSDRNFARHLLLIHSHGVRFPNSGQLVGALLEFHKRLPKTSRPRDAEVLIALAADLAYTSPRAFPASAMIISRLLPALPTADRQTDTIEKIQRKFAQLPNNGYLELWLQRISLRLSPHLHFGEKLCQIAQGAKNVSIWNNTWLPDITLRPKLTGSSIVDKPKLSRTPRAIRPVEVSVFVY